MPVYLNLHFAEPWKNLQKIRGLTKGKAGFLFFSFFYNLIITIWSVDSNEP